MTWKRVKKPKMTWKMRHREKMQKNKHSETLHASDPDAGNLAKGQKSVPKKKVHSGSGNGENGKRENHTQLHHAPAGTPQQSDTR